MGCCAPAAEPLSLALLFWTGLLISLGHCLGMCGPIVTTFALAQRASSRLGLLAALSVYQAGRVVTYAALGALVGLLGSASLLAGDELTVAGVVSVLAGAAMAAGALAWVGLIPGASWLESSALGRAVTRTAAPLLGARSIAGRFALGLLNGLLPCGPVAAAAFSAAGRASAPGGALAMAAFGLGTVPALVVLGTGAGTLPPGLRQRLYRLGAVLMALAGVQLALRGLHALGVVGAFKIGPVVLW